MMILSDNDDDYDDLLMMGSSAVSQLATRRSICPTRPLPKTQCKSTQDEQHCLIQIKMKSQSNVQTHLG